MERPINVFWNFYNLLKDLVVSVKLGSSEATPFGSVLEQLSNTKFKVTDNLNFKIPHTGWNQIKHEKESVLMNKIPNSTEFYFVHSYFYQTDDKDIILNTTNYSGNFISAVQSENIFGVQYHPEKSHDQGLQLLLNFINL